MEEKLRKFLEPYIGQGAVYDHIEQEIINYGTAHPEAPFWDFLNFIKPGLKGVTQEELLTDEDDE